MLEKVGFKNFLALRDVELTLEPFTVIVGPNASGKSSILEGIRTIVQVYSGYPALVSVGSVQNDTTKFLNTLFRSSQSEEIVFSFLINKVENTINFSIRSNSIESRSQTIPVKIKQNIISIEFSKSEAAKASYSENLKPFLEKSGAGLATICAYMQSPKPEKFTWIQESMRQIIPNFRRLIIEPARVNARDWFNVLSEEMNLRDIADRKTGSGHKLMFDFENAKSIPVENVSEGTLFALTVLVAVASSEGETVLLIDDLERGLHPSAVREMIKALREIQKITPELQIIATSHSPYILDKLEPKEVRVAAFDPEIGTMVASLEEYPNFEKWREAMTPGEFWSFVGEDWVKKVYAGRVRV
jgi:AAA15 family ATPase/GTPase